MNVLSQALPNSHYTNPMTGGPLDRLDYIAFVVSHLFSNQQFTYLFSILVGAELIVLTKKIEQNGQGAAGRLYRRNLPIGIYSLSKINLLSKLRLHQSTIIKDRLSSHVG